MFFLGKKPNLVEVGTNTRTRGQAAEDQALAYLQARGLRLLGRNYRTPGRGGGEIDLILQEADGTVVFVEVRSRAHHGFGGAGASIGRAKRQRIVLAAEHWLRQHGAHQPCRLDAVLMDGATITWLRAAFDST
jgi:putative endonuclease